jgi:hypothetical protein
LSELGPDARPLAAADDDVAPRVVDGDNLAFDGPAEVVADVRRPADVHLAGGQKDVDADVDQQAALDLARDRAGDDIALSVLLDDLFPLLLALGLAVTEDDSAAFVFQRLQQDLDPVAGPGRDDLVKAFVVPLA